MLAAHAPVGAPSTWVLSNHDVTRPVTRYGRSDTSFAFATKRFNTPTDRALGTRRARAAALLSAALPGSLYVYQGDELGLPEAEDIPLELRQDPMYFRSEGVDPGRDGCRVPLPWSGTSAPFGFSSEHAPGKPWLPQPASWKNLTVEAEADDPHSMLSLYKTALRIRREDGELGDGPFAWIDAGATALSFRRGDRFISLTNFADHALALPEGAELILASEELVDGKLPPDSTAWLRPQH
jgi:alpha-glucosidase